MTTTTQEVNKAIYQRLHDATNSRDLDRISAAADEAFHPQAVFHGPFPSGLSAAEAVKGAWAMLLRAFPDIQVTAEETMADGDRLVVRNTVRGTHLGEFRGVRPTGRSIAYDEVFFVRFADGRVIEVWGLVDAFSQLQQLGALPS